MYEELKLNEMLLNIG